jgi:hypothetical protein
MLSWLTRNWTVLVVLIAVVLSFIISDSESSRRDRQQANQLVQNCLRASQRTALNAAFAQSAAATRRAHGNERVADEYDAEARGMIVTIPAPAGHRRDAELTRIMFVPNARGSLKAVLTPRARLLQQQGCEESFR